MRHIWTVICSRTAIDRETNNISLFEVLEAIEVVTNQDIAFPTAFPTSISVVTLWARPDLNTPISGEARTRLLGPDGAELMSVTQRVDMSAHPRSRSLGNLIGLRAGGNGIHEFEVSSRPDGATDWTVASRVPLVLTFRVDPSIDSDPATGEGSGRRAA
jgi:hypothetical protein